MGLLEARGPSPVLYLPLLPHPRPFSSSPSSSLFVSLPPLPFPELDDAAGCARGSPVSAGGRERAAAARKRSRCHGACIFPSCVVWRRKPSTSSTSSTSSTKTANPPHIFNVADQAFNRMRKSGRSQCAVVSGESGAGKTESAKQLIKQIIMLSHTGPEGKSLEQKILQVNPLLESFGNAKTVMNNNSSRFGKYTELKFGAKGTLEGAQISEYLLEKSRVVGQAAGERNFHVFYYLFASAAAASFGVTGERLFAAHMPTLVPRVFGCRVPGNLFFWEVKKFHFF